MHFKAKFDQHFVQRVVWSRLTSTLHIIKLESSEAFFAEVREKSVVGFKVVFTFFCKNAVLNIC